MAEKMHFLRAACAVGVAGAAMLGIGPSRADAALSIDLRMPTGNPKSIVDAKVGDTFTINVFARLSGTDATANEGIQSILGSFVASASSPGVVGNFSLDGVAGSWAPSATFNNGGTFQAGKLQDLNSQAGLDLGSTVPAADPANGDYVQARSPSMTVAPNAGTSASPVELLLGSVQYRVTQVNGTGTTSINWFPLVTSGGLTPPQGEPFDANSAIWREDGVNRRPNTGGVLSAGAPITLQAVPEPTAVGLFGLAATGMLVRRRRRS